MLAFLISIYVPLFRLLYPHVCEAKLSSETHHFSKRKCREVSCMCSLSLLATLVYLLFIVYDTTQILSEKWKWKRSSWLYCEYHYLHAAQSIFMRWLTTSYSNLPHIIRILPYNKSARAGSNSYHRSVHYFFMTLTHWFSNFQQDRDSIPKLFIALHG